MSALVVGLILIGLASLVFIFTSWFGTCVNVLIRVAYKRLKQIRREHRPSRIFLVRHGESEANIDRTVYSRVADSQIELTENGHQQARAAGEKLRSIIGKELVYVYLSPYRRSRQTWMDVRKAFSPLQIITEREEPRLREQEFGNNCDLTKIPQEKEDRKRLGEFFYRFPGGESGADVCDRASLFLDTLFREMDRGHHDPTQDIIIVSHGLFIRLFLMRYFHWTVEQLGNFRKLGNCAICQLTKVNGVYTLDEDK